MSQLLQSITKFKYIPSIDILHQVVKIKNQLPTKKYKYLIIFRTHVPNTQLLIDQLIAMLLSHMNNDIYIGISANTELYNLITNMIPSICDYIGIADAYDAKSRVTDINTLLHGIKYFEYIDAKYVIWHSASEYYCKEIDPSFEINYKPKVTNNITDIQNKIDNVHLTHWGVNGHKWWKKFQEDERLVKWCHDNNIAPKWNQVNGIIISKKIMFDVIKSLYPSSNLTCDAEIVPFSYLDKFFDYENKYSFCNCFWGRQQANSAKLHALNVKNKKVDYFTVKRIDQPNGLLTYLHTNYVEPKLKSLGILSTNVYF